MDDIKELNKEITDIGAHISDMLLAWCKENIDICEECLKKIIKAKDQEVANK